MKVYDHLFRLIRSLSKTEKRYFMVYSGMHRETSDGKILFKLIEGMKEYDEQLLREKIRNKALADRLDVSKVQLYNSILRCMRLYHESETVERKIKEMLIDFSFLNNKGLHDQAIRRIEKAKALAWKYEKFNFLPEIIECEINLLVTTGTGDILGQVNDCISDWNKSLKLIANLNEYAGYAHKLAASSRITSTAQQEMLNREMQNLIRSEKYTDEKKALSQRAKRLQSYGLSSWYHHLHDPASALPHHYRQIRLMEENVEHIRENYRAYISPLYNALVCLYSLNRFDEALTMIEKIRAVPELLSPRMRRSPDLRMRILSRVVNVELGIHLKLGNFDPKLLNRGEIREMMEWLEEAEDMVRSRELALSISTFYFGNGDFRKTVQFLKPLLLNPPESLRRNVAAQAYILQMMVHFEKGNDKSIEYLLRTHRRRLEKAGVITEVESIIFDWFSSAACFETSRHNKNWQQFRNHLADTISKRKDHYIIDYIAWADSKINGTSYAEEIRKNISEPVTV